MSLHVTPLNETAPYGRRELCTLSSAQPLVAIVLLWLLLAVVVEELRSQLRAERKRNSELKQMTESLTISQEHANIQLAFYEEEQGMLPASITHC